MSDSDSDEGIPPPSPFGGASVPQTPMSAYSSMPQTPLSLPQTPADGQIYDAADDFDSPLPRDGLPSAPLPSSSSLSVLAPLSSTEIWHSLYTSRYPPDHGKAVSRAERARGQYIATTLTYGEIVYPDFLDVLRLADVICSCEGKLPTSSPPAGEAAGGALDAAAQMAADEKEASKDEAPSRQTLKQYLASLPPVATPQSSGHGGVGYNYLFDDRGVFVDVGCGIGKAVFAAALWGEDGNWRYKKCTGIEILEDLCAECTNTLHYYNRNLKAPDASLLPPPSSSGASSSADVPIPGPVPLPPPLIQFQNADATLFDWSDATVVFMNSTCFDIPLMIRLSAKCRALREGAVIITTTKRIINGGDREDFECLGEWEMEGSWGSCTLYAFVRKTKD